MYYVYILKLNNELSYVGSTPNLKKRLEEHKRGESKYTSKFLPFKVVVYICFTDRLTALRFSEIPQDRLWKSFQKEEVRNIKKNQPRFKGNRGG
jgi:putative endonuclease